ALTGQYATNTGQAVRQSGLVITFSDGTSQLTCTTDATGACQVKFTETSTAPVSFSASIPSGTGTIGSSLQIPAFETPSTAIAASPAPPTPIAADGAGKATITVTVTDSSHSRVPGGVVQFSTTLGSFA